LDAGDEVLTVPFADRQPVITDCPRRRTDGLRRRILCGTPDGRHSANGTLV